MPSTPHSDTPLDRPGALIAALPAVLGFVPEKSIVLVTVADGEMGAVMRADLSQPKETCVPHLAELAAASRADEVIAVIVDAEGASCPMCADLYRDWARDLAVEVARWGIDLLAAHVVDVVAAGGRWSCADGCGAVGTVEDPGASPVAAAAVLDGRRLYARRDELLDVVAVADPAHTAVLAEIIEAAGPLERDRGASAARSDIEHAVECAEQLAAGVVVDNQQAGRLALSLTDPRVRDTLYALAVGDRAGMAEALWADLSRRLPAPWRVEALVLLAFSAYARGDGPLAGISLDAALRCQPLHRMAGMLDQALQSGLRPEQIRELARTGYRLAAQLGVTLPPRQAYGRRAG
ncbi:DUF4192 domain-containing protein [Mycolicibacterium sp. 018/SC-01/001]|uniref:DUF4192 domain-containing protein n=1 Tax=Mycolicibacterium sp. 018/SC-01/001 TaxID=2592069 RepID=UPI00117CB5FA|nr:DUF4192 domain-containing protein [Mycolicibacterium sp. 018/SC-01/001]TRW84863.1 DUF4192 domain-containing protein [Mycolicibacterium sp. 018/SC-01/001]